MKVVVEAEPVVVYSVVVFKNSSVETLRFVCRLLLMLCDCAFNATSIFICAWQQLTSRDTLDVLKHVVIKLWCSIRMFVSFGPKSSFS